MFHVKHYPLSPGRSPGIIEKMKRELQESRDLTEKLKQESIFGEIQELLKSESPVGDGFPSRITG
ncbi:hypothetical protein SCFA_3500006 [anaerobic digester metagenome]|jgi:hypothetical protein|uniref:Uncharacterized protein n=1 Tax=anaerobic digester metagenome TaxID=1263854 RepID=A0A485M3E8_9ZZZZ